MHQIIRRVYSEDVDKSEVQEDMDRCAARDGAGEGATGLPYPISWNSHLCKSEKEAEEWIERHDYSYAQIAVRFEADNVLQMSARYRDLSKRRDQASKRCRELSDSIHYRGVKSAFVSCRKCGSKLSTRYINTNICPLCGKDLRPSSTLEAIKKASDALRELNSELYKEEQECRKKNRRGKGIMWMVKCEYHF